MAPLVTSIETAEIDIARVLHALRPSEKRQLSGWLDCREHVAIFGRAIERVLKSVSGGNDEIVERVYLMGLELRQVFDNRAAQHLDLNDEWTGIWGEIVLAFTGGFYRQSFEDTLDKVYERRSRQPAEPVSYRWGAPFDDDIDADVKELQTVGYMI